MQFRYVFCVLWAATAVTAALGEHSPDLAANCVMNKCWRAAEDGPDMANLPKGRASGRNDCTSFLEQKVTLYPTTTTRTFTFTENVRLVVIPVTITSSVTETSTSKIVISTTMTISPTKTDTLTVAHSAAATLEEEVVDVVTWIKTITVIPYPAVSETSIETNQKPTEISRSIEDATPSSPEGGATHQQFVKSQGSKNKLTFVEKPKFATVFHLDSSGALIAEGLLASTANMSLYYVYLNTKHDVADNNHVLLTCHQGDSLVCSAAQSGQSAFAVCPDAGPGDPGNGPGLLFGTPTTSDCSVVTLRTRSAPQCRK
ncbi:hypothetical protein B0T11DRAFT_333160 [Plectosphaerella cucumerina]|uniref:Uncharacterized protein n=1 Tax=Plectosphaerella cucumerina TaxID=40658 RepID=A0A8K0T6V7_9PEZI|nr:hypothetical protein B0T11DRAFT_333160 [Plectosphaerella cucumerina]